MKISIVVPVYGCREGLLELHKRLTSVIKNITSEYEIIFVDDCCPQKSWIIIKRLCLDDHHVKGIELARNFGQMKAILAGLDNSQGDLIIVMDCDLQDRPEDIPALYSKLQEGYDIVFARRLMRNESYLKTYFAKTFYKLYNFATDGFYDDSLCNFSISKRRVIEEYCSMREQHRAFVMYIKWLGFRQGYVDIIRDERFSGISSYTFMKKVNMALELLTSQSDKILRITVGTGFGITFFSFLSILVNIYNYFTSNITVGWTSIISTICLFGGIIITLIGIVGIYVGNIFIQVKNRPLYVIRNFLNEDS